ncbi:PLD nuclease N-terminal domain-containing protein [Solwaraspora sp. WMMD791]|uniref:PLD nuclease N-terminal domain-containing protein n=1 Tax=Solwaraspora sp. WMMD791 TaxID=3016086 RepID=UPI002499B8D3|nr:PLD nuclease N-terminal domain-containing protein [Solwaraspora sp. WMMD791]WFE27196.1 PLD nuclease N-terminal domain-containing protein [Solwaraspora sp. WMMD791]
MARVFIVLFMLHVVLMAVALISCLSAEKGEVRALPRALWVPVIIVVPLLGPAAWFLSRRPVFGSGAPLGGPGRPGPTTPRNRPLAPDDDPEFLRALDAEQSKQDRELFERWEEDLRRREDEIRREAQTRRPNEPRQENETHSRDAGDREDRRPEQ